jgi:hypothetical protein
LFLNGFSCKFLKSSFTGKIMRELTDQQRLFLIESEQLLTAWREAFRQKQAHRYGMRWVRAADHDYLVRLRDARGNGQSLGRRSLETEHIYAAFMAAKQRADERFATLSAALRQQARLNRAVRLGRLPTLIGRILHQLDLTGAEPGFTVIGTHALYAYETLAAVQFSMDLLASSDVDLLYDPRRSLALTAEKLEGQGLLGLLRKVDRSFAVLAARPFRAVNQAGFMVDLVIPPEGMAVNRAVRFAEEDLAAAEVPSLQWLLNSPRVEATVIAADGQPVLMRTPDPRAFALHKAWLSGQPDREPVKKGRDLGQARLTLQLLMEYLPQYPVDERHLRYFPRALIQQALQTLFGAS